MHISQKESDIFNFTDLSLFETCPISESISGKSNRGREVSISPDTFASSTSSNREGAVKNDPEIAFVIRKMLSILPGEWD